MKNEIERRVFSSELAIETRGEGDNAAPVIAGHAAVFETLSEPMWGFREKIAQGAFDDVLQDDVRGLFNHDPNHVLGRTKSGTLRITVDARGLHYEIDPPETQSARDLVTSMKRGDINQSSFAFSVAEDEWDEDENGMVTRTITKFKRLYDVSPVTYPAYPAADVALRSLDQWREERGAPSSESTCPPELLANAIRIAELEA